MNLEVKRIIYLLTGGQLDLEALGQLLDSDVVQVLQLLLEALLFLLDLHFEVVVLFLEQRDELVRLSHLLSDLDVFV